MFRWENMSEDEMDDWGDESDSNDEDAEEDKTLSRKQFPFFLFDQLDLVLAAAHSDVNTCISVLDAIAQSDSFNTPFANIKDLVDALRKELIHHEPVLPEKNFDSEDLVLLNLLYAPGTSRLHSILKVLSRLETAGYILAWTKAENCTNRHFKPEALEYGCPPIDLVELPRLKLAFEGRFDHAGEYRLYSIDHADLFISNERNPTYNKMIVGIPHSIILSNVRGEMQIVVPVLSVKRPSIKDEPFSTFIVLDRTAVESLAERYFLYPVHISFSFLLTKGVNSAIYLLLLRFLHRDHAEVFRLADSIATDNAFNKEGLDIFQRLQAANDDCHPDAHACRLKIFLVTIDANMELPWEQTLQCAAYIIKLDSISSFCRLSVREELQILESDLVVKSSQSPRYDKSIHDEYSMALVFNRLNYLKARVRNLDDSNDLEVRCTIPARTVGSNWSYYQDNTIFGEHYEKLQGIYSIEDKEKKEGSWKYEMMGGDQQDAPEGGWLVVAVFRADWSPDCVSTI